MARTEHHTIHVSTLLPAILAIAGALAAGVVLPDLTHVVLGLFSVSLLVGIFTFAWHTRAFITSDYFLLLGIGSLPMALLHSVHLLSHPSVGLIPGGIETATRALAGAGLFLGVSLGVAPTFLGRRLRPFPVLTASIVLSGAAIALILLVDIVVFHTAGGTPTTSHTVIHLGLAALLIGGLARLRRNGDRLDADVFHAVTGATFAAAAAKFAFSLEILVPAYAGLAGHVALALAFYLFFRAVVETGLTRPHSVLFHELKQSEANVREMSLRDDLTGLLNRRGFFSLAEQQMRISMRTGHNMLLFYCDLDAMKAINDSLGHSEGDRALADVAQILRETFRESDILARFGGDEFVVLAIETDATSVAILRDRLEKRVSDFNRSRGRPYDLKLSMGIATYDPLLTETIDDVLSRADAQMYRHKQARRTTSKERSTTWSD